MKSDGKIETFGGVKGQTNLMIIKEAPKTTVTIVSQTRILYAAMYKSVVYKLSL